MLANSRISVEETFDALQGNALAIGSAELAGCSLKRRPSVEVAYTRPAALSELNHIDHPLAVCTTVGSYKPVGESNAKPPSKVKTIPFVAQSVEVAE